MKKRLVPKRVRDRLARQLYIQTLEDRRLMALTSPDVISTFSPSDNYAAPYEVQSLVAPKIVTNSRGRSSYDLRSNIPGDQTIHFDGLPVNEVPRTAIEKTSVSFLVDPKARYELRAFLPWDANSLPVEAYDAAGQFIASFPLRTEDDPSALDSGIHLAYLGGTDQVGVPNRILPPNTSELVFTAGYYISLGFVGDRFESGSQPIAWNDEPRISSSTKVDFVEADQAIQIESNKSYALSAQVTSDPNNVPKHSLGYTAFDRDGLNIEPIHVQRYLGASDTYLETDLRPGDTFINLRDASGWSNLSSDTLTRSIAWYGYRDKQGQVFTDFTYTRNTASDPINGLWSAGGVVGNRITLNAPWSGPGIAAGTAVRNAVAGKSLYTLADITGSNSMESRVEGFWQRGIRDSAAFPPATAFIRPAALLNQVADLSGPTWLQYQLRSGEPIAKMPGGSTIRTFDIDVLANDAKDKGLFIESVTQPEFGTASIVQGSSGGPDKVRFVAPAYFSGNVQFRYVARSRITNELATETVTVSSLANNLDADPTLKQSISSANTVRPVRNSFVVTMNERLESRQNNSDRLLGDERSMTFGFYFELTRAPSNGSLDFMPNGEFRYQPNKDFVGSDTFEYLLSNATHRVPSIAQITVVASHAEHDLLRIGTIGLGQHIFESTYKKIFYSSGGSPKLFDATGAPFVSWRVHLLPFVGYDDLYRQFKLDEPWDGPNNLPLLDKMPDIFRSGDDPIGTTSTRFQTIQAFEEPSPTAHFLKSNNAPIINTFSRITRALNNILLVVQSGADRAVPWTKPQDLPFNKSNPIGTLGTIPAGFTAAVFGDGRARWIRTDMTNSEFTSIATVLQTPANDAIDVATLARKWGQESNWQLSAKASITENFRQLGLGLSKYESAFKRLPPAASTDTSGKPLLSWRVLILPAIGGQELYNRFRLNEPWDSPNNIQLLKEMPDIFRSREANWDDTNTRIRVLDGAGTAYDRTRIVPLRYRDFVDGLSNSILFVEAGTDKAVPWTMPETLPVDMSNILASLGNLPLPTITIGVADGAVVSLPKTVTNAQLAAFATIDSQKKPVGSLPPEELNVWRMFPSTAATGMHVRNSLQQIMIGILNYESTFKKFPGDCWGQNRCTGVLKAAPTLSWRVAILPYIEHQSLYDQFNLNEPWDSPHNLALLPLMPNVFRGVGDPPDSVNSRVLSFAGNDALMNSSGKAIKWGNITDGSSNTLALAAVGPDKGVPWTKPGDIDAEVADIWAAIGAGRTTYVAFTDGSRELISQSDAPYLNGLAYMSDGGVSSASSSFNLPTPIVSKDRIILREGDFDRLDIIAPVANMRLEFDGGDVVTMKETKDLRGQYYASGPNASFLFSATNNVTLNGPRHFQLRLLKPSIPRDTTSPYILAKAIDVIVLDDEGLSLSLSAQVVQGEGDRLTARVSRGSLDTSAPLKVLLASNRNDLITLPQAVTIPIGQSIVEFSIEVSGCVSGTRPESVHIFASALGLVDAEAKLEFLPANDTVLTFDNSTMSERGGRITATLSRQSCLASSLTFALATSDLNKAAVQPTVSLASGQSSVSFVVHAIDNDLLEGSKSIEITATSIFSVLTGTVVITDYETVSIATRETSISERGGSTRWTVSRNNSNIQQAITLVLSSSDPTEARVPSTVTIPANAASTTFDIDAVDDDLLDGSQSVLVTAVAEGYVGDSKSITVSDAESLSLTIDKTSISEFEGTAIVQVTRSNSDTGSPLAVTLNNGDATEVSIPATVTIPADQRSVSFLLTSVDDTLLDGTQFVSILAQAEGYSAGQATLSVNDSESLTLSIDVSTVSEGGSIVTAVIRRNNSDIALPLSVQLVSSDNSEVAVPQVVDIPAGQASVVFEIRPMNDGLLDGKQSATIFASATGYTGDSKSIEVLDTETLVLFTGFDKMSEKDGRLTAVVTRNNTNNELPLIVSLSSSDTTEAIVPATVTIPANQRSVTFFIDAVDDTLLDGKNSVSVRAIAEGYFAAERLFEVTDSESISFSIDVQSIPEKNGVAIGTLSRSNTDNAQPLLVTLQNDDPTQVTVPPTVTIPAGQSQVTFSISSVNDTLVDGTHSVHIQATAANYDGVASAFLNVFDDDRNFPWQNPRNRYDVNDDGVLAPLDALLVIGAVTSRQQLTSPPTDPFIPARYVDVNGDGLVSPLDVLLVISELNRTRSGIGEGESRSAPRIATEKQNDSAKFDMAMELIAQEIEAANKRRIRQFIKQS